MCTVGTFGIPRMGDQRNAGRPRSAGPDRSPGSGRGIRARTRRAPSRRGRRPSRTRGPRIIDMTPPPPGWPPWSWRSQGLRSNRPGAVRLRVGTGPRPRPRWPRRRRRSGRAGSRTRAGASVCRRSMRLRSGQSMGSDVDGSPEAGPRKGAESAGLPQRLAQDHGGRDRDIERTQARPHRNDDPRLRRLMHLVRNAGGFPADENDVVAFGRRNSV